ncbi:MAG TPA: WD40 repeat domain-containing protein, partial [Gemmataceae bacterium]|nr:WD40 repeat domain-containing protein [Gemmataceae bacterium]
MQGRKSMLVLAVGLAAALVARSGEPMPRRDADGVPLPAGVLARLGSARFRPGASVKDMAVSPDGRLLAAVYLPNDYCDLWNTATGKRVRRIDLHRISAFADSQLRFTDRGATLVVVTAYKTVQVRWFEVATGKEQRRLELLSRRGDSPVLAPSAGLVAIRGLDRSVRIYNLANGSEVCHWQVGGRIAVGLSFSPDGRRLAVCDLTNSVRIHDTSTGQRLRTLKRDRFSVGWVIYSQNGQALVTRIYDRDDHEHTGAVSIWDPATGKERSRLRGSIWYGIPLAISADAKTVATGGEDNAIELWDSATGRKLRQLQTRALPMRACFFPDGKTIAVSSNSGTITLWDVNTGRLLPISPDPVTAVSAVWFSADGRQVIGSADRLMAWDAANGRLVREYPASSATPFPYALSVDGALAASAGREHDLPAIDLWDTRSGKQVRTLRPPGNEPIMALRFTPDGHRLISGGGDETVRVWEVATGRVLYTLEGHGAVVNRLAISRDGRWLASASDRGRADPDVRLWDLSKGREVRHFHPRFAWASALAFSSDGRYLAVGGEAPHGGERSVAQVWETATGKEWRVFTGPKGGISCVAWSPDDRMLAVGDRAMMEIGANDHTV